MVEYSQNKQRGRDRSARYRALCLVRRDFKHIGTTFLFAILPMGFCQELLRTSFGWIDFWKKYVDGPVD